MREDLLCFLKEVSPPGCQLQFLTCAIVDLQYSPNPRVTLIRPDGCIALVSMGMFVFTTDGIQQLHEWTHASISIVLDHLSTFSAADYQRDLPGFGFSTLQKQVVAFSTAKDFGSCAKGAPLC